MQQTSNISASRCVLSKPVQDSEDERSRIARELHDDIGQRLALLADDADRLRRELKLTDHSERLRLDSLVDQARQLSEDLRRISHLLHPSIVEDLGLVKALRSLVDDFISRTGKRVKLVDFKVPDNLPTSHSAALYRITQEALRNIAKHAGKAIVKMQLSCNTREVILLISDTGIGFESVRESGLGFTSMRERAEMLGGTLKITSVPNQGTSIEVNLPLNAGRSD